MPEDSLLRFPALAAYLKQLKQLRAALDQAHVDHVLCLVQQYRQYRPDAGTLQAMTQAVQTQVMMLHRLDQQLAWLFPESVAPAASAPPQGQETALPITPKADVVDAHPDWIRSCKGCGRPVAPRQHRCPPCKTAHNRQRWCLSKNKH